MIKMSSGHNLARLGCVGAWSPQTLTSSPLLSVDILHLYSRRHILPPAVGGARAATAGDDGAEFDIDGGGALPTDAISEAFTRARAGAGTPWLLEASILAYSVN